MLCAVTVRGG